MTHVRNIVERAWLVPPIVWMVFIVLPFVGLHSSDQRQIITIVVYCLVTAGLNLSFGYAGELALGQVAVMAVGAYAAAVLSVHGVNDLLLALLCAAAAAAIVGFVTGVPGLRLSRWALGLVSFFLILLLPGAVQALQSQTGGLEGTTVNAPSLFGHTLSSTRALYVVAIVIVGLWLFVFRNLVHSRYGRSLQNLRESPLLIESLGISANKTRLSAYVLGSIPAGIGGCIYGFESTYISPTPFDMSIVVAVIAASVVGGAASVYGSTIGATLLVLGPLQAQSFAKYSIAVYGLFLLIVGTMFASGLAGAARRITQRVLGRRLTEAPVELGVEPTSLRTSISGGRLEVRGVRKAFGGVKALDGADLLAVPGEITAIIGSNGAGKTTLLNAVSGFIRPDEGALSIDGTNLLRRSAPKVARLGVSRSFQTPLIPRGMTVEEVVVSGRLRDGRWNMVSSILRLPKHYKERRADVVLARELLGLAGLGRAQGVEAKDLPLGSRRLLEVLRSVASGPAVILLDEPAAGLDDQALADLARLLSALRRAGATIVLIEHNVPFVLGLSDTVFVMELGKTISQGTPDEVRRDPAVIASYLGRRGDVSVAEQAAASWGGVDE